MSQELQEYYETEGLEELRLQKNSIQYTEFLTMTRYLDQVLSKGSRVLDPCAGTGIYSFYLADKGHIVAAGDLFERNVKAIEDGERQRTIRSSGKPLEDIYLGDIRDLSAFENESFDAVLCMGALYHLHDPDERKKALDQCFRVLKKGGILVATYINRLGAIVCNFSEDITDYEEIMEFYRTGVEGVFYAHTPLQIEEELAVFPFEPIHHIGLDGIGFLLHGITKTISDSGLENWRNYHFQTCEIRELLGYSYHGALIGKKV